MTDHMTNGNSNGKHALDMTPDGLIEQEYQVTYRQTVNLRSPGPTPLPRRVVQAMTHEMIFHRTQECRDLVEDVVTNLHKVFQTQHDIFIYPASGTGGWEAVVANLFSPGDHVLNVSTGEFGERFGEVAEAFGLRVEKMAFEWGEAIDLGRLEDFLRQPQMADIKGVLCVHNETSTGVTNDIKAIARLVKGMGKVLAVDSVSGLGGINLEQDNWGVDVVLTTTQKTWMSPPGLMMMSVGPDAWAMHKEAKMPRYYWDWTKAKKFMDKWETPSTPPISILYAIQEALHMMMEETLQGVFDRHARVARMCREGGQALGLTLFPNVDSEERYSNTVSSFDVPQAIGGSSRILKYMREQHKIVLAGGQGKTKEGMLRIGHMGYVSEADIQLVLDRLKLALPVLSAAELATA